jgi:mRNA interferase MazF
MGIKQYSIYWVQLDPTQGSEIAKTRPCVVISPIDINEILHTVVVAPLTSTIRNYAFRVSCCIAGRDGEIAVDQIRTVDKGRIKEKKIIGQLSFAEIEELQATINDLFCC